MRPSPIRSSCFRRTIGVSTSLAFNVSARPTLEWVCKRCCLRLQERQHDQQSRSLSTITRPRTLPLRRTSYLPIVQSGAIAIQHRAVSSNANNSQAIGRGDLPSQTEGRRSHVAKRFSHVMDHLQSNIFIAGQRLNDLTGYSGIEALKKDIEEQGPSQHGKG